MGVLDAIEKSKAKVAPQSASQRVWDGLSKDDQSAIRQALQSGETGAGKLDSLLREEGVDLGRYMLGKVKRGEV